MVMTSRHRQLVELHVTQLTNDPSFPFLSFYLGYLFLEAGVCIYTEIIIPTEDYVNRHHDLETRFYVK